MFLPDKLLARQVDRRRSEKPRAMNGGRAANVGRTMLTLCFWAALSLVFGAGAAQAQSRLYYNFSNGFPQGGLTYDSAVDTATAPAGSVFGVIRIYGPARSGISAVYMLSPPTISGGAWLYSTVYQFSKEMVAGPMTADNAGNLYGMAQWRSGSVATPSRCGFNCGGIFMLSPPAVAGDSWTARWLHHFRFSQGAWPHLNRLTIGPSGVIYGTAPYGGDPSCNSNDGCGTAFMLSPPAVTGTSAWAFKVIRKFHPGVRGSIPFGGLAVDHSGAVFGTTLHGGLDDCGVLFQLMPPAVTGSEWTEKILRKFGRNANDLCAPVGDLAIGDNNEIFGATNLGGADGNAGVFEARPPALTLTGFWDVRPIYHFKSNHDAARPGGGLIRDPTTGTLYGFTAVSAPIGIGGAYSLTPDPAHPADPFAWVEMYALNVSTVFQVPVLAPDGLYITESVGETQANEVSFPELIPGAPTARKP
jgi:hypothetical protein